MPPVARSSPRTKSTNLMRHKHKRWPTLTTKPRLKNPSRLPATLAKSGVASHCRQVASHRRGTGNCSLASPLSRQETILQRIGVEIPRATLANWMIKVGTLIQPIINLLRERLLEYDIVQIDETTVQVLKESGKSAQSKSYLRLQRGGDSTGQELVVQ